MIEPIASVADPRLDDYLRMTDVRLRSALEPERGLFMAESYHVIERALEAGCAPRSFLMSEKWRAKFAPLFERYPDVPVFVGPEALLEELTGFHLHRGALAAMQRPALASVAEVLRCARTSQTAEGNGRTRVAVLEGLVDHTNVGACFRSAAAMGVDAVLVTPTCADPLYRRSVRVSMGTVFQVPWTRIGDWPAGIRELQDGGFVVAGMTLADGAITLDELVAEDHRALALVLGSEGHGLASETDRLLDRRVRIPMQHGVDSLNVAAASAVAFYATR